MKLIVRILFKAYKFVVSPMLHWITGPGSGCRFIPSCSEYFAEAVETHGFCKGSSLGVRRLCRCHPWGKSGYDPVPGVDTPPVSHQSLISSE